MNIKAKIKERGFTLERVASLMTPPVTKGTLSQIVNGNPTLNKLREIASIIGISVSELIADETDTSDFIAMIRRGGEFYHVASISELESLIQQWKK